ncbi:MAG: 1,4-alpha-glucan branching protein GlgB [Ignavibacteriales bacterium]|nr:1,4-alpha-glucan branching protein GlgB [Ignavibacteriales bacterium]
MPVMTPKDEIRRIVETDHHDPFQVLGAHVKSIGKKAAVVVRAFLPDAESAAVVSLAKSGKGKEYSMAKIHEGGFFEALIASRRKVFPYKLRMTTYDRRTEEFFDSYAFLPTLTDFDLHLFGSGDHHRIYDRLGAHFMEINGIGGVQFAVWAPNARSVSVVGDFNGWDRRKHAMRVLGASGVWEIFIPGLPERELYKFSVKTQDGTLLDKTDPYATEMEFRPRTASKINFLTGYIWGDDQWMSDRPKADWLARPISVYEVHLSSWARVPEDNNRWLTYREMAEKLVPYVHERGFTHVEFMPVLEHPLDASWGYQVTGYYAPTSRHGTPQDLMHLVDRFHQSNIGVILDWVPAHFPRDPHALSEFDGTHLYEHADPRKGFHQDWGTYIFNYGRNEVKNFLAGSALFWVEKYHVDGLRIDAVASMLYLDYSRKEGEWIPNEFGGRENLEAIAFIKHVNGLLRHYFPGVLTIAEESTAWPGVTNDLPNGGLGFHLKWNMGWMHDTLQYFSKDPVYRVHHQGTLTFALLYAFTERFLMPLSHDEVVHGKASLLSKMPGDDWQKFANLRALFGLMYGFPGKKLLFMGGEIGQWNEWNHDASVDWHLGQYERHRGIRRWVEDLNKLYQNEKALHEVDFHFSGFEWIDFSDAASSVVSFIRRSAHNRSWIVIVSNFTPVPRHGYRVGVPEAGDYNEILNSDSSYYGGSNVGNAGTIPADSVGHHGRGYSLNLTLPPLSIVFLKRKQS